MSINKRKITVIILIMVMLCLNACASDVPQTEIRQQDETVPTYDAQDKEQTISVNVTEETVEVDGLDREYDIFFLADSHISLCDDRDPDLMEKAASRSPMFKTGGIESWDRFDALMAASKDSDMVILGGDIIDSAMYASIDHVKEQLDTLTVPYLYSMGNHDFEYGSEYFSPTAYEQYLPRLNDMRDDSPYQVREYDDLIVFTADDDNSQIDAPILEAYRSEAAKGKPIVLVVHVPIEPATGDDTLTEKCKEVWGPSADGKSRVTMGINGCYPNDSTREFIDLVLADDSPVVLVLAGHIHFYHKDMLNDNVVQIVTGAAFDGDALKIRLK